MDSDVLDLEAAGWIKLNLRNSDGCSITPNSFVCGPSPSDGSTFEVVRDTNHNYSLFEKQRAFKHQ